MAAEPRSNALLPVAGHQLTRPRRLAHRTTRTELGHVRLHVEHRCSIDGVESAHAQLQPVDADQLARGDPDAVRPRLRTLSEDPDLGPIGASPGMAGAE